MADRVSRLSRLSIDVLRTDGGTQPRAEIDHSTVQDYADALYEGATMPPVVAYYDGSRYWLADGYHRLEAHRAADHDEILVDLRQGTRRDAVLYSVGANADHGLRRSRADKRRAVETLLRDPEWSTWSDRAIAAACRVSPTFVGTVRATVHVDSGPRSNARIGRDGRRIDVSGLQARAEPPPPHPPADDTDAGRSAPVEAQPPAPPSDPAERPAGGRTTCRRCGRTNEDHPAFGGAGPAFYCSTCRDDSSSAPSVEPPPPTDAGSGIDLRAGFAELQRQRVERGLQEEPAEGLADDERAHLDGYWTPDATALACVRWLDHRLQLIPRRVIEPSVGGGAWVRACRQVWPYTPVLRCDLDPLAPGLLEDLVDGESYRVGDWLDDLDGWLDGYQGSTVIVGNRPYNGSLQEWVEISLQRADVVALLERETITGTEARLPWWRAHRPAWIAKVVPRPKWGGPGARTTSDFADSVLIVWTREPVTQTRWDWIDASAGGKA